MARRSYINTSIENAIGNAVVATMGLYVDEYNITAEPIIEEYLKPHIKRYDDGLAAMPKPIRAVIDDSAPQTKPVRVVVPFPTMRCRTLGNHYPRHGSLDTFDEYLKSTVDDDPDRPEARISFRGVTYEIFLPEGWHFPSHSFWGGGQGTMVTSHRDGLVIQPGDMTHDSYEHLLKGSMRLYKSLLQLEYMQRFALSVAEHVTTPGICKRIWPDAKTFLAPTLAREVDDARLSQWPKGIRGQLQDYTKNKEDVTKEYLRKQLNSITNMILAAQLAPEWPDNSKFSEGTIRDVTFCSISHRILFDR